MPITYRRSGEEILVQAGTDAQQQQSSIMALPSGGFVVSWMSLGSEGELYTQVFDANGAALGEVTARPAHFNCFPDIIALDTGGFVVTWGGYDSQGLGISGQMFQADGTPVGDEFTLNTRQAEVQTRPSISTLPSGGFVATWMDMDAPGGDYDLKAQIFGPNGAKIGGEFLVAAATVDGEPSRPSVATLPSGEFVITWHEAGDSHDALGVKAQRFSASGQKIGAEISVNAAMAMVQAEPDITALSSGGFVITWTDWSGVGGDTDYGAIKAQIFGASGQKVGGEFRVNTSTAFTQDSAAIASLPNGGFVVTWFDGGDEHSRIKAQVFSANGARVGGEMSVTTDSGGSRPAVTVLPTGEIVVSWDSGDQIKAQILSPINEIRGTSGFDMLTGTALDDEIFGFVGDDRLNGGAGDDLLDGGAGIDRMAGSTGDDSYIVNDAGDTVVEKAGEGTDSVRASVSFTLASHVENLTLAGLAVSGTGNILQNHITGTARNNVLDGAVAADIMVGGAGNDVYIVDNRKDQAVELDGEGTDRVESRVSFKLGAGVEDLVLTGFVGGDGTGNELDNRITGNDSFNVLNGGAGNDILRGGGHNDTYIVDSSLDQVIEAFGAGNDLVKSGADFVLGNHVEDLTLTGLAIRGTGNTLANGLIGNARANILQGGAGADDLIGLIGNDRLYGGTGNDSLNGGAGLDRFYFDTALSGTGNVDRIYEFSTADDFIHLDRSVFTGIDADGRLRADAFHAGTAAADAEDRIVYNAETGQLFYDADGSGAGKAVLFAQLTTGLDLTAADFIAYSPQI